MAKFLDTLFEKSKENIRKNKKLQENLAQMNKNKGRAFSDARKQGAGLTEAFKKRALIHSISATGGPTDTKNINRLRRETKELEQKRR